MAKTIVNMTEVLANAANCSKRIAKRKCKGAENINTFFAGLMMAATAVYDSDEEMKERNCLARKMVWGEEIDSLRSKFVESIPSIVTREEVKTLEDFMDDLAKNSVCDAPLALDTLLKNYRTEAINNLLKGTKDEDHGNGGNPAPSEDKKHPEVPSKEKSLRLEKMINMDTRVRARLLERNDGQEDAVNLFLNTIWENDFENFALESRRGVRGAFTFVGAPACGMVHMAVEAASELRCQYLFMDMKNYATEGSAARILGNAAEKKGVFSALLGKKQSSIIVVKNFGSASDDVQFMFQRILETGRIDNLSFENAILIFLAEIPDTDLDYAKGCVDKDYDRVISGLRKFGYSSDLLTEKDKLPVYYALAEMSFQASVFTLTTPVFFNKPSLTTLEKIAHVSFDSVTDKLQKAFDLDVAVDDKVYTALLYAQQDEYDALNLHENAKKFVTGEMKKLLSLFDPVSAYGSLNKIKKLMFYVDAKNESTEIQSLFRKTEKTGILFVGLVDGIPSRLRNELEDFNIYMAEDGEDAVKILKKHDIQIVVMQMDSDIKVVKPENEEDDDFFDARAKKVDTEDTELKKATVEMFDFVPIGSSDLEGRRNDLKLIHENFKDLPIYIAESSYFAIDNELRNALIMEGAKGIIQLELGNKEIASFVKKLKFVGKNLYIQDQIYSLKKQSKVLKFETTPLYDDKENVMYIRLKHFALKQIVANEDSDVDVEAANHIHIGFNDVIGADGAKEELKTFVDYLKNPAKFIAGGLRAPKGVLLHGKPGTGKTMLAKALAAEAGVAFLAIEASSIFGKYVGDEHRIIKELFAKARKYAPSIVFIDEIDTIGKARSGNSSTLARLEEQALTTLLTELDGAKTDPKRPVFVMGATNYGVDKAKNSLGVLDPALVRRFDRTIYVELPNKKGRLEYLKRETADETVFDVTRNNLRQIAERTAGSSLADLSNVIEFAKRKALKAGSEVTDDVLNEALDEILHGEKLEWGEEIMKRVAYHEAGHALMCALNGRTPAYASITARNNMGSMVADVKDGFIQTKERLLEEIGECLAGRAAEVLAYGKRGGITTGAGEDLRHATEIAKAIICTLGMDDSLFVFSEEDMKNPYYAQLIHGKVNEILNTEMANTEKSLQDNKKTLEALADALLDKNQLTRDEIEDILDETGAM